MPAALLDPAQKYLRLKCGLPTSPRPSMIDADPDDPSQRLLTTAEAAKAAHVPEATLRDWAADHTESGGRPPLIYAADRDAHGRPLYRELEVLQVELRTRNSPRGAVRSRRLAEEALAALDAAT